MLAVVAAVVLVGIGAVLAGGGGEDDAGEAGQSSDRNLSDEDVLRRVLDEEGYYEFATSSDAELREAGEGTCELLEGASSEADVMAYAANMGDQMGIGTESALTLFALFEAAYCPDALEGLS